MPSGDRAEAGPTVEHLLRFLDERTGYHVEGAVLRSYGLVIEEILAGRSEVAFLHPDRRRSVVPNSSWAMSCRPR